MDIEEICLTFKYGEQIEEQHAGIAAIKPEGLQQNNMKPNTSFNKVDRTCWTPSIQNWKTRPLKLLDTKREKA